MNPCTSGSSVSRISSRGSGLPDPSLMQKGDPVRDGERALDVVGDDHAGDPELMTGAHHQVVHGRRGDRIEPGGGLVV